MKTPLKMLVKAKDFLIENIIGIILAPPIAAAFSLKNISELIRNIDKTMNWIQPIITLFIIYLSIIYIKNRFKKIELKLDTESSNSILVTKINVLRKIVDFRTKLIDLPAPLGFKSKLEIAVTTPEGFTKEKDRLLRIEYLESEKEEIIKEILENKENYEPIDQTLKSIDIIYDEYNRDFKNFSRRTKRN
jgi:hypothetical protein